MLLKFTFSLYSCSLKLLRKFTHIKQPSSGCSSFKGSPNCKSKQITHSCEKYCFFFLQRYCKLSLKSRISFLITVISYLHMEPLSDWLYSSRSLIQINAGSIREKLQLFFLVTVGYSYFHFMMRLVSVCHFQLFLKSYPWKY